MFDDDILIISDPSDGTSGGLPVRMLSSFDEIAVGSSIETTVKVVRTL